MLSSAGGKLSLSMREVNQLTGEDLNPKAAAATGANAIAVGSKGTDDLAAFRDAARNPDLPFGDTGRPVSWFFFSFSLVG